MSILKIRKETTPHTTATADYVLDSFSNLLDIYTEYKTEQGKREVVGSLILDYSTYSYIYMTKIAITLKAEDDMKATMTYMNSVLAEILHEMNIAYFHPEEGYSIVDKAFSYYLDNGDEGFYDYLDTVIEDMKPVVEEEFEEEQEEG